MMASVPSGGYAGAETAVITRTDDCPSSDARIEVSVTPAASRVLVQG